MSTAVATYFLYGIEFCIYIPNYAIVVKEYLCHCIDLNRFISSVSQSGSPQFYSRLGLKYLKGASQALNAALPLQRRVVYQFYLFILI